MTLDPDAAEVNVVTPEATLNVPPVLAKPATSASERLPEPPSAKVPLVRSVPPLRVIVLVDPPSCESADAVTALPSIRNPPVTLLVDPVRSSVPGPKTD